MSTKTDTLLISIQNLEPAKKILIAVYSIQIILLLAKRDFEIFGRVFHQEKMKQENEMEHNKEKNIPWKNIRLGLVGFL